jgi:hypothetical protein
VAAAAATTSGPATAPTDLDAALVALQARDAALEAEAQWARAVATTLELQLAAVLGVAAPPPRPATATTSALVAAPRQAAPTADAFEISSVSYLHAQAVGIQDIRTLVPVVLGVTSTQYPRWRDLVLLTLQRYALDDHISSDTPTLDDPHWRRMDNVVPSWLLGTITVDLQETTRDCDRTVQQLWVALEEQFLGNREARALHLDT